MNKKWIWIVGFCLGATLGWYIADTAILAFIVSLVVLYVGVLSN